MKSGRLSSDVQLPILQWSHVCLIVTEKYTQVFTDGHLVHGYNITRTPKNQLRISFGGSIYWPTTTATEEFGSYSGDIVNPEVWQGILPMKYIRDSISKCLNSSTESETNWELKGNTISSGIINDTVPCSEQQFDYVVIPKKSVFEKNYAECESYGMIAADPSTSDQYNLLFGSLKLQETSCFSDGVGGWLRPVNGFTHECRAVTEQKNEILVSCTLELCGLCEFHYRHRTFYLRGICSIEEADLSFKVGKLDDSSMYFQGVTGYVIVRNLDTWILKSSIEGPVLAKLKNENIIGTKRWSVQTSFCRKAVGEVTASFNSCNEHQSWCGTGVCIAATRRCNSFIDCSDGSDEKNCTLISKMKSSALVDSTNVNQKPVSVSVQAELLRIYQLDDSQAILAVIKYLLIWTDTKITLTNINRAGPSAIDPSTIWTPTLVPSGVPPNPLDCVGEECGEPLSVIVYPNSPIKDSRTSPIGGTLKLQL